MCCCLICDSMLVVSLMNVNTCSNQGQKNRIFQPKYRRNIGFQPTWKRFLQKIIGSQKIGEKSVKSPIFCRKITTVEHAPHRRVLAEKIGDKSPIFHPFFKNKTSHLYLTRAYAGISEKISVKYR